MMSQDKSTCLRDNLSTFKLSQPCISELCTPFSISTITGPDGTWKFEASVKVAQFGGTRSSSQTSSGAPAANHSPRSKTFQNDKGKHNFAKGKHNLQIWVPHQGAHCRCIPQVCSQLGKKPILRQSKDLRVGTTTHSTLKSNKIRSPDKTQRNTYFLKSDWHIHTLDAPRWDEVVDLRDSQQSSVHLSLFKHSLVSGKSHWNYWNSTTICKKLQSLRIRNTEYFWSRTSKHFTSTMTLIQKYMKWIHSNLLNSGGY